MKKLLALLLAAALLLAVTACGGKTDPDASDPAHEESAITDDHGGEIIAPEDSDDSDVTISTAEAETDTTSSDGGTTPTTGADGKTEKPGKKTTTVAKGATSKQDFSKLKGTTVRIHSGSQPSDKEKAFAKSFESKYGCKVEYTVVSWTELQTKLVQMVSSKTPMDYFKMSDQNFINYAVKKLIQPVDDYIDINNKYYSKTFMDMFRWNGKRYVLYNPANYLSHYAFIFYNKTMFEDKGVKEPIAWYNEGKWTFDQLRKTAQEMTEDTNDDGKTDIYGFGTWWYEGLLMANGNSEVTINQNGTIDITLQQKSAYTAMQLIENMQLVDHSYEWTANASDLFLNSKLAMIFDRPWEAIGAYDMYNKDYFPDEIGICPAPKGPDTGSTVYAPTLIHGMAIPNGARNPLGAVAWFLSDAEYNEQHQNDADILKDRRRMISDEHRKFALDYIAKTTPLCSFSNSIGSWETTKWEMWAGILRDNVPPATIVTQKVGLLKNEIQRTLGGDSGAIND